MTNNKQRGSRINVERNKTMKNYRIICYWPSEVWEVLGRIEKDDHTTDWMTAYHCSAKGKDGYNEAKNWLKENEK